jgi:nucleoside-diphosphate-sugar epimerase
VASPSEAARVLLTGASGFTGRYVQAALREAGHEVVDAEATGTRFDLTDPESVAAVVRTAAPDCVIHLAALSFVGHNDAAAFYAVNCVGATNLLEALIAAGRPMRRVVIASSANIYGNARIEPITEDTPPAPVNHYAASKLAMEHMARSYVDRLPVVMTRPFNYTGPGQPEHFLVPKLVAHFARRAPAIELGNLDVVRDFSDVRTVAQAYVRLLDADFDAGFVNLCSGTGRSLRWVLEQLAELSGHTLEVKVNPAFVRASEVHRLVGSAARMRQALGDLPHRDFRDTLDWMLRTASSRAADH